MSQSETIVKAVLFLLNREKKWCVWIVVSLFRNIFAFV